MSSFFVAFTARSYTIYIQGLGISRKSRNLEVVHLSRSRDNLLVFKAVRIIDREYMWAISEEDVAESLGITPQHFSFLFRSVMNVTFVYYCNAYRINKSLELLLKTDAPLSRIAEDVGFHSVSYYIKIFKKISGFTPREYKRKANLMNRFQ